jgi:hypothetical protein
VNWKSAILRLWKRREVKLLIGGTVLAVSAVCFLHRSDPHSKVTLEFVGYERRGTNQVEGTILAFRLKNHSIKDITYLGVHTESTPICEVEPMDGNDRQHQVIGGIMKPLQRGAGIIPTPYSVLRSGEERTVYCQVYLAEQSWLMKMSYWEGTQTNRVASWLPSGIQSQFVRSIHNLPKKTLASKPVHRIIPFLGRHSYGNYMYQTNGNGRVIAKWVWSK